METQREIDRTFQGQKFSLRDCLTVQQIYERAIVASEVGGIPIKDAIDTVLSNRQAVAQDRKQGYNFKQAGLVHR